MPVFPELLRAALRRCNRIGIPLAAGIAVFGSLAVLTQIQVWHHAASALSAEVRQISGEERFAALQTEMAAEGGGPAAARASVSRMLDEVNVHILRLPEERREGATIDFLLRVARMAARTVAPFAALLLLLQIAAWTYLLAIAGRGSAQVMESVAAWIRRLPTIAGTWLGMMLCACAWFPLGVFLTGFVYRPALILVFPSLVPFAVLLPRFLLAPAIAASEGTGITASLQAAWDRTRGRWLTVVWNMAGVTAIVWICTSLCQGFLEFLVGSVTQYSVSGLLLYMLTPFIALISMAYRLAFGVELAEGLKR